MIDVLLNFSRNTIHVEPSLLKVSGVAQSGHVEDANLGKGLCLVATLKNTRTYHYAVFASKSVKAGLTGPTLIDRNTLVVGVIEGVVVNVVTSKDIGD